MSAILEVKGLVKAYPSFRLQEVGFSLEEGRITGFIGRNGAGKTTTLHALLGFLAPDAGEIRFWGQEFGKHELAIKRRVGFVSAGMSFYERVRLSRITAVTRSFYDDWDDAAYRRYLAAFALDESKAPSALSNGMKIKYALALALSHNAELLILDEPTSGLDPVSREELLEIFLGLANEGQTILFSTHITSDLDKTADDILYIRNGAICAEMPLADFRRAYRLVRYRREELDAAAESLLIGERREKDGCSALVRAADAPRLALRAEDADLDAIMVHLEKEA